jgi:hypothetical protein
MRCTVNTDGRLVTLKGSYLDDARFDALRPHDILGSTTMRLDCNRSLHLSLIQGADRIAALRLQLLTAILSPLDLLISALKKEKNTCCSLSAMTMLGSLIISAAKAGLDPIPRSGSEFRGSVKELVEKLDGLSVTFLHENKRPLTLYLS